MSLDDEFRLRGRVLRLLAEFFRSPFNDGSMYVEAVTIAGAVGGDMEEVVRICDAEVGNLVLERAAPVSPSAYRLRQGWLLERAREQQDREVADIALTGRQ